MPMSGLKSAQKRSKALWQKRTATTAMVAPRRLKQASAASLLRASLLQAAASKLAASLDIPTLQTETPSLDGSGISHHKDGTILASNLGNGATTIKARLTFHLGSESHVSGACFRRLKLRSCICPAFFTFDVDEACVLRDSWCASMCGEVDGIVKWFSVLPAGDYDTLIARTLCDTEMLRQTSNGSEVVQAQIIVL
ncbi:hypothetical protein Tco_0286820 [Tanacetum coccineum]